jgi:hypothetical protein
MQKKTGSKIGKSTWAIAADNKKEKLMQNRFFYRSNLGRS